MALETLRCVSYYPSHGSGGFVAFEYTELRISLLGLKVCDGMIYYVRVLGMGGLNEWFMEIKLGAYFTVVWRGWLKPIFRASVKYICTQSSSA